MAETPITIKLGGQTFIRTSDMIVKTLSKPGFNTTTLSLNDSETGADYQVPTGKVFRALVVYHTQSINVAPDAGQLFASVTADTADGTEVLEMVGIVNVPARFEISIDFAADLFVTSVSVSGPSIFEIVIGIEMDA